MAFLGASSSAGGAPASPFGLPITEKLSKTNLVLWKAQVLPAIHGAQLEGLLDGTIPPPPKEIVIKDGKGPSPDYASWVALDQQVLNYLLTTMSRDVLAQVATATTAAGLWKAVEEVFSSTRRARSVNTRIALATTKKGNMTATDYIAKMKSFADEMAIAGKPLGDEEFTSFVLTGLGPHYNPLVTSVVTRIEPISFNELQSQIISFEQRLELLNEGYQSSANAATRGRGSGGYGNGGRC
ncbi:unnamed protein product [Urochloa humidicola]